MKISRTISILVSVFVIVLFTNNYVAVATSAPPEITAPSGILIDAATGDVLYEKNAHDKMYPASTTKIMTAILALENTKLSDIVVIDKETPFTDGSRMYVIEDELLTVEQLLYAIMVESANDAAVALAKHISGSVEEFAVLMNKRAKELGALNTNFVNPNGLPNKDHVSTAYDLAMIARHGVTIPKFVELANTVRYQIPPTNKQEETRYFKTSNRLLWGVGSSNKIQYKGKWVDIKDDKIEGIKTGYTVEAQQCLVSSVSQDSNRFISVVLKAQGTNIYVDTRTLLDYGLESYEFIEVVKRNSVITSAPINNGVENEVSVGVQTDFFKAIPKELSKNSISSEIILKEEINAPVEKNDVLGKVIYQMDGKEIGEVNLVAMKSIPAKESLTAVYFFSQSLNSKFAVISTSLIVLFLIWRTVVTIVRMNKRNKLIIHRKKKERDVIRQMTYDKFTEIYKRK